MKYSILVLFLLLVGCSVEPAPVGLKCSEGYNPYYRSTNSEVVFKCVEK